MFKIKNRANIQDLVKFIALISMMIDHWGFYLAQDEYLFRVIGRFVLPIFAFYTGYNFHGKMRHIIWIFGAILIGLHIYVYTIFTSNILITFAFGQLYLSYVGKAILANEQMFFLHFIVMLVSTVFTYEIMDYGTLGIAIMMIGYKARNEGEVDGSYLALAMICTAIFNEYIMSQAYHHLLYEIIAALLAISAGLCLKYADHNKSIPLNIRPITRNMLYIYFVSIIGFIMVAYNRVFHII